MKQGIRNYLKRKLTWDRIVILIVLALLLPELYTQHCLARSRSVRMEILLHSEGIGYHLGQRLSKKQLKEDFSRAMYKCGTDDLLGDLAGIPWDIGYYLNERRIRCIDIRGFPDPVPVPFLFKREGIQYIGIRGFPSPQFSPDRIVDICLNNDGFQLYGIYRGMEMEEAKQCLIRHGYCYEYFGYWKGDVKITLADYNNTVTSMEIKLYTHKQHQAMIKAYEKRQKAFDSQS